MKLEDLKVGQYVRFKDKRGNTYVRKIKEVCDEKPEKSWGAIIIDKNANNVPYVSLKNIVKASFDVIDLIEVGDYVNGYQVIEQPYTFQNIKFISIDTEDSWGWGKGEMPINEIKSIVTHEQMEQMSYKLGE